jgi:hypothetical protein
LCSQGLVTRPYPQPDETIPLSPILSLLDPLSYYTPFMSRYSKWALSLRFHHKILCALLFFLVRATWAAQPHFTVLTIFVDQLYYSPLIPRLCFLPSFSFLFFLRFVFYFHLFSCDAFGRFPFQLRQNMDYRTCRFSFFCSVIPRKCLEVTPN